MRTSWLSAILLIVSSLHAHGAEVIRLSTFPASSDPVVETCRDAAVTAARDASKICMPPGGGGYPLCDEGQPIKLKVLHACQHDAPHAANQAEMLYLLGLLYQDLDIRPVEAGCPKFFWLQEGSGVCVYGNHHYNELIKEYPQSIYADMAAFNKAQAAYRYYECEGQELCSVENDISGSIRFLARRSASELAPMATQRIVEALDRLPTLTLDPAAESPSGLLDDIKNLRRIAKRLSPENRKKLTKSLDAAEPLLIKLEEEGRRPQGSGR